MKEICSFTLIALFLANVASGGDLSISGQDLSWSPTTEPSPRLFIEINNDTGTGDLLLAWELTLEIVPDVNATGSVQFMSASKPPDYLFPDGSTGIGPPFSGPSDTIGPLGDGYFLGVIVPSDPSPGRNLVQVDFVASSDADGGFDILAVPDEHGSSSWYSSDFAPRAYLEIPFGGGPVNVGSVLIVSEPSSVVLLALGTIFLSFCRFGSRRRRGRRSQCIPKT